MMFNSFICYCQNSFPIFAVGTAGRPSQYETLQIGRFVNGKRLHRPSWPISRTDSR